MSADNWDICPKCVANAVEELEARKAKVQEAYGKVSIEEFEAMRADTPETVDPEDFRTFREDYEFWGARDGVVHASYKGHCKECGTDLGFKSDHPIDLG